MSRNPLARRGPTPRSKTVLASRARAGNSGSARPVPRRCGRRPRAAVDAAQASSACRNGRSRRVSPRRAPAGPDAAPRPSPPPAPAALRSRPPRPHRRARRDGPPPGHPSRCAGWAARAPPGAARRSRGGSHSRGAASLRQALHQHPVRERGREGAHDLELILLCRALHGSLHANDNSLLPAMTVCEQIWRFYNMRGRWSGRLCTGRLPREDRSGRLRSGRGVGPGRPRSGAAPSAHKQKGLAIRQPLALSS